MNSLAQNINLLISKIIKNRLSEVLQPGSIQHILKQEINTIINQALNQQLELERDNFLQRKPYVRKSPCIYRNGFKLTHAPGIFCLLRLRKPVIRKGSYKSPLLKAIKSAGKSLSHFLALNFWLRGSATRATAKTVNAALGTKLSHTTISSITNPL